MKKKDTTKIDEEIIRLYGLIGIEINPKKTGIAARKGIEVSNELSKYEKITNENKYKYLGLHIFEVNERKINDEMIIEKVNQRLEELKSLELNNKTTIRYV